MLRVHVLVGETIQGEDSPASLVPPAAAHFWIEAKAPTEAERERLVKELGVHPLAIEDALLIGHPPKLEDFGDHLFFIAHTPDEEEDGSTRKLALFVSKQWVLVVARAPCPRTDTVIERVMRTPGRYLQTPAVFAHALLDYMTDAFEASVDDMAERAAELEDTTHGIDSRDAVDEEVFGSIARLRRESSRLRQVVRGQRDVALALARDPHAVIPKKVQPYMRDVYDHLVRVHDLLEGVRETLGSARDAYLAAINNRLSDVMRVLTVIATVMMPLSLLAGIFGMNFDQMPGTGGRMGFWAFVFVMIGIAGGMLAFFRRRGWL
jgi:magnesium transporter